VFIIKTLDLTNYYTDIYGIVNVKPPKNAKKGLKQFKYRI